MFESPKHLTNSHWPLRLQPRLTLTCWSAGRARKASAESAGDNGDKPQAAIVTSQSTWKQLWRHLQRILPRQDVQRRGMMPCRGFGGPLWRDKKRLSFVFACHEIRFILIAFSLFGMWRSGGICDSLKQ